MLSAINLCVCVSLGGKVGGSGGTNVMLNMVWVSKLSGRGMDHYQSVVVWVQQLSGNPYCQVLVHSLSFSSPFPSLRPSSQTLPRGLLMQQNMVWCI